MVFCARSKKARLLSALMASGTFLSWQPFRLRFLRLESRPRTELSARVRLLSAIFNVFSRRVTKALLGTNLILLPLRSSRLMSRSCRRGSTGMYLNKYESDLGS